MPGDGGLRFDLEREIPTLAAGEFHYVRVVQEDGGVAWSSPIYSALPSPAAATENGATNGFHGAE